MLRRAAEDYVYNTGDDRSPAVADRAPPDRSPGAELTWLAELTRCVTGCDWAGLALLETRARHLVPLVEVGTLWRAESVWREIEHALTTTTPLEDATQLALGPDCVLVRERSPAGHDGRESLTRVLVTAPIYIKRRLAGALAIERRDGAEEALSELIPLVRAMAKLASGML
jgi:hypothetical protein